MPHSAEPAERADAPAAPASDAEAPWRVFPRALGLELVYAEPPAGRRFEDLPDPFVSLGERGRFSRSLAARIVGPNGSGVREVALKMQSDEYPVGSLPNWSNVDVDAQWDEQYAAVRAAAERAVAPEVVDVLPLPSNGGPPQLPPILFCKLRRAFFAAPCPVCGETLHVCRDNALLEANRLPRYDGSLERFLYCARCSASADHRFYTLILGDPALRERAPVGEQTELFRALDKLARAGGPLPCYGCSNVPTCYPAGADGDALRYLTPLSFYDFRCFASERLDMHYDDFVASLGGDRGGGGSDSGRAHTAYLFEHDPRGRLPLEILRLKLIAFTQVVARVLELHRHTQRPHLGLAPENIMVRLGEPAPGLPAAYRYSLRLLGIATFLPRKFEGLDATGLVVPLLMAAPFRDSTFASTLLAPGAGAQEGSLTIAAVSRDERGQPVVDGELRSNAFDVRTLTPKDAVHITVRQGRPLPLTMELLANPTRIEAECIRVRSAGLRADEAQSRQLEALAGQAAVRAAFTVYPCLHVPCDIESLGILLMTTLAANAVQRPPIVASVARALAQQLLELQRGRADGGTDDLARIARDLVQRQPGDSPLAPRNLFHDPHRFPEEAAPALEPYWHAAIILALRALTRAPGFGFCRAHDDFDPTHPEGPANHFLSELEMLGHLIDEELFLIQGKRREITAAVARVRQLLRDASADPAGGSAR
jgi:hypothetical protein